MSCQFEDFLAEVPPEYRAFAATTHETMLRGGYRTKAASKAGGFFVSYSHPKTRRGILKFLFHKKEFYVRIYADHCDRYADFINRLPESMEHAIRKASNCKRLKNPSDHGRRCVMGYDVLVGDTRYQKCRYDCFQFLVTHESIPVLSEFIENEHRQRL